MVRKFGFLLFAVLLASYAYAGDTTFEVCVVNGDTGNIAAGVEVSVRHTGILITRGYTDANGCFDSEFVYSGDPAQVEFDFTSADYLPWYGYPSFECEVIYPVSPPFISCKAMVRLVPRISPATALTNPRMQR